MRLSYLLPLLSLAAPLLAAPKEASPEKAIETEEATVKPTIFNDEEVPPLRELSGTTIDEDTKQGYWYAI